MNIFGINKRGKMTLRYHNFQRIFAITISVFALILTAIFVPYSNIKDKVEAITDMTGDPSVTVTSTNDTANVMIEPTASGAFMSTSGNGDIAFSVSTSNYTGYELSVSSTKTTLDYNTFSLSSITSDVTEEQFSASANTQYNNKWGYKPSFYNSLANTKYYGITTSSVVLDQTNAANSTAKNYSISVGARANLNTPAGTYSNDNIVLTTVANTVPSSILTVNYSTGVSSITIAGQTIPDGETVKLIQGVPYTITMTPSTDYAFSSWSATDGTVTSTSTQSTTYTIDTNDATLTTGTSFIGPDIQNLAQSDCTTTPSLAKDTRDDHIYTVQRLADGNCWMMESLDLGRTTLSTDLTSSNTNLSTTVTASTFNGWKKTSGTSTDTASEFIPVDGTDSTSGTAYGTLYNYCAASAGTICTVNNYSDAQYDICPAGWRLPTGGNSGEFQALYTQYNSIALMRSSIANSGAAFAFAGDFYSGASMALGEMGVFWSSTRSDSSNMNFLMLTESYIGTTMSNERSFGFSVRCIMKKPSHTLTVSYGTGVSSVKVNNITIQNGGTISLEQGISYSITMTPSSNYVFSSWSATSGTVGSTSTQTTTYVIGSSNATLTAATSFNGTYIQNISASSCTTTPSTVFDSRDMHTYTIQRLNDGNCWMMENLDLGRTTLSTSLTSSNTNLSTTITASTFNGWKKTSGTATYTAGEFISRDGTDGTSGTPYGTLYNYCAASAGTICSTMNYDNAGYDICPAGWRLPTGGSSGELANLYTQYGSVSSMRASIANSGAAFALSGGFSDSTPYSTGSWTYYWASTNNSNTAMHDLGISSSSINQIDGSLRYYGQPIRCIHEETVSRTITVSYGTGVASVIINNVTVPNGGTIKLKPSVAYSLTMVPSVNYKFSSWSATYGTVGSASTQTTTYTAGSSNATLTASATSTSYNMQNLSPSNCTTSTAYAKDTRDNHIYTIKRLADGSCWMMENLDLGRTTLTTDLTSSNTNISTTVTASTFNSWKKTSETSTSTFTDGVFISIDGTDPNSGTAYGSVYNYYAASAGTISGLSNPYNEAPYDICPAGWRLPTGGSSGEFQTLYTHYNSFDLMMKPIPYGGISFARAGYIYGGTGAYDNGIGAYWSSTDESGSQSYYLSIVNKNNIDPVDYQQRSSGYSIRCILNEVNTSISDMTYLQDFRNLSSAERASVVNSMSYDTTYNLIDNRDNKTYKVAKLKDNNIWMTENLDLGRTNLSTNLTSSNTNLSSTISYSTFNSWRVSTLNNTTNSGQFINASGTDPTSGTPNGTEYNFYAASAGTISGSTNSSDAIYDICPAGWRLPTGGNYNEFVLLISSYSWDESKMTIPVTSGGAAFALYSHWYPGSIGYYWTSTSYDDSNMWNGYFSSSVASSTYVNRDSVSTMRCIWIH